MTPCKRCSYNLKPNQYKCPSCNYWQTSESSQYTDESVLLKDVKSAEGDRLDVGPWNRIWGGGLVRTSLTLFGGMPGAGKSTVLLQILNVICLNMQRESLYIATEEALPEIKMRADRLSINTDIRLVPAMTGIADPGAILLKRQPCAVVLDSLQGMIGPNEQMGVELLSNLKKYAVTLNAPIIVVSHVNKSDDFAGLMTYQHAVDTLLLMSPDEDGIRTLEVQKNRYGQAFIESQFEMTAHGLIPVLADNEEEDEENEDD